MTAGMASQVVGRAWAGSVESTDGRVLVQVGLDRADVLAELLEKQERRIEMLVRRVEELERREVASTTP